MTNAQIIADVAITMGIYTENQIEEFIKAGREIPLHTYQGWASRGNYKVKKGEHGVETRLWRRKVKTDKIKDNEEPVLEYYLAKAFLFSERQVEKVEEDKNNDRYNKIQS